MVSNRSGYVSGSSTDDETCDMDYKPANQKTKGRKPTRVPKCFTKNALMARENRLKKKMYITSLEEEVDSLKIENQKLKALNENQLIAISNFKREISYLRSVIANSEDIKKLMRNINVSTGLSVTSSVNKEVRPDTTTELSNNNVKEELKNTTSTVPTWDPSKHPWEEDSYVNYPTPESTKSHYSSPDFEDLKNDNLLLDVEIPLEMNDEDFFDIIDEKALETPIIPSPDQSYHSFVKTEEEMDQDVGVCLHVSKNRVSLEFCPTCCDTAKQNWVAT